MSLPWRFSIRDSTVKTAAAPSRSPSEDSHHQKHTSTRHPGTDETSQQPPETPGSSGGRRQQKPGGPSSCSLRPPITRPSSGPPLSGYHLGAKPGGLCFGGEVCSRSSPRAPHLPAPGLRGAASPSPPPCRAAGPRSCLFFFFCLSAPPRRLQLRVVAAKRQTEPRQAVLTSWCAGTRR